MGDSGGGTLTVGTHGRRLLQSAGTTGWGMAVAIPVAFAAVVGGALLAWAWVTLRRRRKLHACLQQGQVPAVAFQRRAGEPQGMESCYLLLRVGWRVLTLHASLLLRAGSHATA